MQNNETYEAGKIEKVAPSCGMFPASRSQNHHPVARNQLRTTHNKRHVVSRLTKYSPLFQRGPHVNKIWIC